MSMLRVNHLPHPATTPGEELTALASVYRRAIERYEEEKAASVPSTDGDDAKGSLKHEVRANTSLP